jgi:hypothetical protein
MDTPISQKRVITCQGTIQLITALSVVTYRAQEENSPIDAFENYLVIYDLYAPAEQIHDFISLIKQIASSLGGWKSMVYIAPEQLTAIAGQLHYTSESNIFKSIYDLVGTDEATEIYLCRNWQFSNYLLINAYKTAEKICYGDSVGIYFSSTSSAFFPAQPSRKLSFREKVIQRLVTVPKQHLSNYKARLQARLGLKTILKAVDFNQGYFTLPDIMGEVPPMPYKKIGPNYILAIITPLTSQVDTDYLTHLHDAIGDAPVAVLLTSNFSEAGRMSYEDELKAYFQFLSAADLLPNTVLIIKPHPRDDLKKIQQLQDYLSALFSKIVALSEPELFFLPFEILFLRAFLCPSPSSPPNTQPVQVFAVSSACLGLKLLFDVPSLVGFGEEITSNTFYKDYVEGRLTHERDLTAAIQSITDQLKPVQDLS